MDYERLAKKIFSMKFVKYVCVNVFTYGLMLALTYSLTEFGKIYYFYSYVFSMAVTIVISFALAMRVIFNVRGRAYSRFARYIFFLLLFSGINAILVKFVTEFVGIYYMLSIILVTGCMFTFKYLTYKQKVFQEDF